MTAMAPRLKPFQASLLMLSVAWVVSAYAQAGKLQPETIQAFNKYVKAAEEMMQKSLEGEQSFLWIDREDPQVRVRLREGEIVLRHFEEKTSIPGGLIHDWLGAVFIPGATAEEVVRVLQDCDRHKEIYPEVVDSKLLGRNGDTVRGYLRFVKKKMITVVLNTEHEASYYRLSEERWHGRSYSTRIAQLKDAGKTNERELPVGEDSGFLWRLYAYWRVDEVDGGVFAECNAISLSRSIPRILGWMIKPFLASVPKESLVSTLKATRMAVVSKPDLP